MRYFAYGSCRNVSDFRRTCPRARRIDSHARLLHYRLRFNGYSMSRGGGVANVEKAHGKVVCGVLWEISKADLVRLDCREGAPHVYRRIPIEVVTDTGVVSAFTYVLTKPFPMDFAPSWSYRDLLLDSIEEKPYRKEVLKQIAEIEREEMEDVERTRTLGKRGIVSSLGEALF